MFQLFSKRRKGYTLVEILIVVSIISILLGIVLVALGPAGKQGKEARIISDLHQLQNIAENIYLEEGNYSKLNCSGPPAGFSEVKALCDDVAKQGSLLQIPSPTSVYCAYAILDPATTRSFCVDYSGSAKEVFNPSLSCGPGSLC